MIHFGDKRREFLAKLLGDFAKLIVATLVATKVLGEVNWAVRLMALVVLVFVVIIILIVHPEGR